MKTQPFGHRLFPWKGAVLECLNCSMRHAQVRLPPAILPAGSATVRTRNQTGCPPSAPLSRPGCEASFPDSACLAPSENASRCADEFAPNDNQAQRGGARFDRLRWPDGCNTHNLQQPRAPSVSAVPRLPTNRSNGQMTNSFPGDMCNRSRWRRQAKPMSFPFRSPSSRSRNYLGEDLADAIETLSGQVQHAVSLPSIRKRPRCLLGAAPSWGDEPTQREITLLSNEKNGQDRCWPAAPHLNCFSVAEGAGR